MQARHLKLPAIALTIFAFGGCATSHEVKTESEVKPIHIITEHRVEPIHITVDINVDRKLDDFFGDIDKKSDLIEYEDPAHQNEQPTP